MTGGHSTGETESPPFRVWVAWYGYAHEGDYLVGVYSSKEKAEAALGRISAHWGSSRGVMPVEVNADPENSGRIRWEDHRGEGPDEDT